ncbi:MAG TPA: recombination-associated protein RdgC [Gammaproteobacteria bacterium]|nr:recombination-associated protein RdgC [Gammaproteobacteria bacterium]
MFRNLRLYRFASPWPESESELSDALRTAAFRPCGAYSEQSSGWESPTGDPESPLCRRVAGADLIRLRSQSRLLPAAAVNEALEQRLEEYRGRTGQEPTRRDRRRLKEQTRDELLPKALLKSDRLRGFCLFHERLIGIDTASEARAEHFLERLRAALGDLAVAPLTFRRPVSRLLTEIFLGRGPRPFVLGRECRLQDPADVKSSVRCVDMDLADPTVRNHVKEGMVVSHLAVEIGQAFRCVIDDKGTLGKLKLAGDDESEDDTDGIDPLARLDAEIALLTGTVRQLVETLERVLGAAEPDGAFAPDGVTEAGAAA